jgi:hypothetical protein
MISIPRKFRSYHDFQVWQGKKDAKRGPKYAKRKIRFSMWRDKHYMGGVLCAGTIGNMCTVYAWRTWSDMVSHARKEANSNRKQFRAFVAGNLARMAALQAEKERGLALMCER